MKRTRFGQDIRPLSEFRANAAAFIEQVRTTRRPLILTQNGRGAAVLLDVGEYERLVEQVELLQEVRTAEEQLANGLGVSHEDGRAQMLEYLRR